MEQKPHKKEELMLAHNVLKLAEALLKVSLSTVSFRKILKSSQALFIYLGARESVQDFRPVGQPVSVQRDEGDHSVSIFGCPHRIVRIQTEALQNQTEGVNQDLSW